MKKLAIDFEFASRTWWNGGGQALWDALTEAFDGSAVIVDDDLAASWLEQARQLEGWDDGPDYAPHPIRVGDVEEEDAELL